MLDAGYASLWIGKYLNKLALLTTEAWRQHKAAWTQLDVMQTGRYYDYTVRTKSGSVYYADHHSTQMVADRAVMRMRQVPASQPIFALLSPFDLHRPNEPMARFAGDSRCANVPPWNPPNYNEADVSDKPAYVRALPRLPDAAGWSMVRYCEQMLGVDWLVERVTAELRAQNRLANTLLVFTADNGVSWGSHRFGQRKGNPYTTPVPLYMSWPARWGTDPRTIDEHVSNIDLAPTFCAVAGCQIGPFASGQAGPDGVSLLPLLDGDVAGLGRDALLEAMLSGPNTWTALRTTARHPLGLWHYVEHSTGERELYDLEADPWELDNRYGQEGYGGVTATLATRLEELRLEGRPSGVGSIRVVLDALPDAGRDFAFSGDLGDFVLDDDADGSQPRARTFSALAPGTYAITQADVSGWSVTDVSCTPAEATDRAARTATVELAAGESVTCTFTDALRRPDASIALTSGGAYKGNDVYGATPTSAQTQRRDDIAAGRTYAYWVRIQNDSLRTDAFTLAGVATGSASMSVSYWSGATDITARVAAGTYTTARLAPGATASIVVRIAVGAAAGPTDIMRAVVTASSVARPERVDVVRAIAAR